MSDNDEPKAKSRAAVKCAFFLGGLFLYVLSIGPIEWIASRSARVVPNWFNNVVEVVYWPLDGVADHWVWFDKFLDWYIGLALR